MLGEHYPGNMVLVTAEIRVPPAPHHLPPQGLTLGQAPVGSGALTNQRGKHQYPQQDAQQCGSQLAPQWPFQILSGDVCQKNICFVAFTFVLKVLQKEKNNTAHHNVF